MLIPTSQPLVDLDRSVSGRRQAACAVDSEHLVDAPQGKPRGDGQSEVDELVVRICRVQPRPEVVVHREVVRGESRRELGGLHYTEPDVVFPFLNLCERELIALCVAEQAVEACRGTAFSAPLRSLLLKLERELAGKFDLTREKIAEAFSFETGGFQPSLNPKLFEIVSAARPVLVTVISRVAVVPRATVPKLSEPLTAILPVTPVPLAGSW